MQYTPSDCFGTFPRLRGYPTGERLTPAGREYHTHRYALMVDADEGLTKIYNRFHKRDEGDSAIQQLRELHDAMDRAVLRAYGWDDLAETVRPQFLTEEIEDDHTYQGRYFWPADQRDAVLSRLLALNAERHAEEVTAGIAPTGGRRVAEEEDEDVNDDEQESLALD